MVRDGQMLCARIKYGASLIIKRKKIVLVLPACKENLMQIILLELRCLKLLAVGC